MHNHVQTLRQSSKAAETNSSISQIVGKSIMKRQRRGSPDLRSANKAAGQLDERAGHGAFSRPPLKKQKALSGVVAAKSSNVGQKRASMAEITAQIKTNPTSVTNLPEPKPISQQILDSPNRISHTASKTRRDGESSLKKTQEKRKRSRSPNAQSKTTQSGLRDEEFYSTANQPLESKGVLPEQRTKECKTGGDRSTTYQKSKTPSADDSVVTI